MAKTYDQPAIELARTLYCKYGGKSLDRLEREMRDAGYAGWLQQNLFNRGKDENFREGWISKYGFDKSLKLHVETQIESVTDDVQKLYIEIKTAREKVGEKVKSGRANKDEINAHINYIRLEISAIKDLDLSKDSYEIFVVCFEKLLAWLPEVNEPAALALLTGDVAERLLERARTDYGEQENKSVA